MSEFVKISVFSDFLAKKISVFSDFLAEKILVFSDFLAKKILVFSDFFVEKILVILNYDVYLYSINGYKSVNLWRRLWFSSGRHTKSC